MRDTERDCCVGRGDGTMKNCFEPLAADCSKRPLDMKSCEVAIAADSLDIAVTR